MKPTPVLLLFTLLLSAVSHAAVASEEEALTRLLNDFLAGASVNDAAAHERFWSEELVYTSSRGLRFGKAEILEGMRASADSESEGSGTIYSAEDIQIRLYGETAVVAFRLLGSPEDGSADAQQYFNTGTFVRRGGEWRVVAWQATMIPESE